ncbi:MAG: flagellar protein FlaG [Rhodocyclaceae bacterium]|nr:flagellar protein FlaG [Rhodocyclaceae bacterium]
MVTSVQPQAAPQPPAPQGAGGQARPREEAPPILGKPPTAVSENLVRVRPPVGEPAADQPGAQATRQAVERAAEDIRKKLSDAYKDLQISVDDVLKRPVVRVVDANSGQLVIQVPSEEAVRIARRLESLSGVLLKGKA